MKKIPTHRCQIPITADDIQVDRSIADLYIGFSGELLRLSLIGIGAFGFLFKPEAPLFGTVPAPVRGVLITALVMLMLAACLALLHRYLASQSIAYQVSTLRSMKLLEVQEDEEARTRWKADLERERLGWRRSLLWSGKAIAFCAVALALGIVCSVVGLLAVFSA
ncbi:MAG: hypothetical protein IPN62_02470 [Flavobacteriales bacterium]|nr:hypothetical protein [Flavobacteriales bacterium]